MVGLGHPQYGNMAANLASSIRAMDKDMPIHLVHTASSITHFTDKHKALFTSMQECPKEFYTKGNKQVYLKAKTHIYELSPFEQTLFLDADMIWFSDDTHKNASTILDELKGVALTFQNRGFFDLHEEKIKEDYIYWCNIKEVKEKYFKGAIDKDKGRFYHLHSEFIYFERSEAIEDFFTTAQMIFDEPLVKAADFDGDIPDELAFDIAVAVTGMNPHKDFYLPIHWYNTEGMFNERVDRTRFTGISIGGNNIPQRVLEKYNGFARYYARVMGLPYHFNAHPKKQWSKTRKNV